MIGTQEDSIVSDYNWQADSMGCWELAIQELKKRHDSGEHIAKLSHFRSEREMPHLIGLVGPMGCGKTTLAKLLVENHGFIRTRLAEPIKLMLGQLLVIQGVPDSEIFEMLDGSKKEIPSPYFDNTTPRHAMQTLGTEWRNLVSQDLWVNIWDRMVHKQLADNRNVVVDDVRFLHEAARIRSLKGVVVKIEREDLQYGTHISETENKSIPTAFTIINNTTPEAMLEQINHILK